MSVQISVAPKCPNNAPKMCHLKFTVTDYLLGWGTAFPDPTASRKRNPLTLPYPPLRLAHSASAPPGVFSSYASDTQHGVRRCLLRGALIKNNPLEKLLYLTTAVNILAKLSDFIYEYLCNKLSSKFY